MHLPCMQEVHDKYGTTTCRVNAGCMYTCCAGRQASELTDAMTCPTSVWPRHGRSPAAAAGLHPLAGVHRLLWALPARPAKQ